MMSDWGMSSNGRKATCLCPQCHRFLHYGRHDERRDALEKIYADRADGLKKAQLVMTQAQFLKYTLGFQ